ncbi:MAG: tetratricopeptide repeat protein [Armatimonadetes bacterium]|nr:tetratricopeptide repeat protein [Armatimonadota bacterium]
MSTSPEELQTQLAATTDSRERAIILVKLGMALSRIEPTEGLAYAEEAQKAARQLRDDITRAHALHAIACCHETLAQYQPALAAAQKARWLFQKRGDQIGEGTCLNAIAVIAHGMGDYPTGLSALAEAREIFTAQEDQPGLASAFNNTGMMYQELGNYPEALNAYLQALQINEGLGNEQLVGVNIGNVSNIYFYLGDNERSFQYDLRALEIARRLNDQYGIGHTLDNISSHHKTRGDYQAALDALTESLEIFRQMQAKRYESAILIKLGALHEQQQQPEAALEQYHAATTIAEAIGDANTLANAQAHIGMMHHKQGNYLLAIPVLNDAITTAEASANPRIVCETKRLIAESLAATGDHTAAFAQLQEHLVLLTELSSEQQRKSVAEAQARFDVERTEREREVLRLRNQHLEETMELRNKELTTLAMNLVQKNTFLQKLRKQTEQLAEEHPTAKLAMKALMREIAENLRGDDDWERFQQEFQHVHHDFIRRIASDHPKLTPTELKVCALLKVNLSNKEIANLLSISLRSIESHRYSIRKKMGLAGEISLAAYLAAV